MRKRVVICERERTREIIRTHEYTRKMTVAELWNARNAAKRSTLFDSVAVWQKAPVWQWNDHFLSFSCQMAQLASADHSQSADQNLTFFLSTWRILFFPVAVPIEISWWFFSIWFVYRQLCETKRNHFHIKPGIPRFRSDPVSVCDGERDGTNGNWNSLNHKHTQKKLSRHFFGRFQPSRMTFFFPVLLFLTVILVFPIWMTLTEKPHSHTDRWQLLWEAEWRTIFFSWYKLKQYKPRRQI